jgi:hypothetical protein
VLAIAVLGNVMATEFSRHLNSSLENVTMPAAARTSLQSNEIRMAALKPPEGVDPHTAGVIGSSIIASFVFSFRLMMWICSALALASAVVAWWTIPSGVELRAARQMN